jgi:hypothetical protein
VRDGVVVGWETDSLWSWLSGDLNVRFGRCTTANFH